MNTTFMPRLLRRIAPVALVALCAAWQVPALAATNCASGTCIFNGNGDNALSNEEARQNKEQWDDTRMLRKKVNNRAEKEFDKFDNAIDQREDCEKSLNLNAYWEANTERCLDRRTGRQINP
ncbi:hypothetical protein CYR32_12735 [Chimaeribacter coloradensis]|uniref:UPF0482 protein CYR32_12735 n=2 Tax=Chimaeribacter coloradensis TaxID=2060068 RepID=A0A2N5E176_9GAMM|nr:DUF1283 family protein [Chimaeribacter coloradensis]PLR34073.1 hypothetical protein CYR32_12735 [Chimaeribacter coloradensis]